MTNLYFFHLHACYSIFQNFFCAGIQFFIVLNSYEFFTKEPKYGYWFWSNTVSYRKPSCYRRKNLLYKSASLWIFFIREDIIDESLAKLLILRIAAYNHFISQLFHNDFKLRYILLFYFAEYSEIRYIFFLVFPEKSHLDYMLNKKVVCVVLFNVKKT